MATKMASAVRAHQAASLLGVHKRTVLRMLRIGKLRGVKNGQAGPTSPWLIDMGSVNEILNERQAIFRGKQNGK